MQRFIRPVSRWNLVDGPQARGGQLHQMAVGVPEIEAHAAPWPTDFAFDRHLFFLQPVLPSLQLGRWDGECEMELPIAVMGWYHAARCGHRGRRAALAEQKKHLASRDIESTKPVVPTDGLELKGFLIEPD